MPKHGLRHCTAAPHVRPPILAGVGRHRNRGCATASEPRLTGCRCRAAPTLLAFLGRLGIGHRRVVHPPLSPSRNRRRCAGRSRARIPRICSFGTRRSRVPGHRREDAAIELSRCTAASARAAASPSAPPRSCARLLGVEPGSVTPFAAMNDRDGRVRSCWTAPAAARDRSTSTRSKHHDHHHRACDLIRFLEATATPPSARSGAAGRGRCGAS